MTSHLNTDGFSGEVGSAARSRRGLVGLLALLAAVAALPYANTLRNGFVYDDFDQVLRNPYLRDWRHLREIFTTSVWSYMGDYRAASNYYRPMMNLGYLLGQRFFGPHPFAFHLTSLLLNAGVVLVLFLVTRRMFNSDGVGMIAACLFALHPIHTEAVDWIAAVTELELSLFFLSTFGLYLWSARPTGRCSVPLQFAMAVGFVGALLSKEQAVMLPPLATLYEHLYREDREETTWVQKFSRYGTLWLLAAAYLVVRGVFLGGIAPREQSRGLGLFEVFIAALALFGQYLGKLFWPARLCGYYVFPRGLAPLLPGALHGVVAAAMCAALFAYLWWAKRLRAASFGLLWVLVTLAPVLNIRWLANNVFTERYLYLPSVGFCWLVAWAAMLVWNTLAARAPVWRGAMLAVAGVVAALGAFRIVTRNPDWRDNITFFTKTLAASPDAYDIHNNLGAAYWAQGNVKAAEKEWLAALALSPEREYVLCNLGLLAREQHRYEEAMAYFLRCLQVKPNFSDAHMGLGQTYAALGRTQEAEIQLRAAVALSPLSVAARNTLGEFYFDQGRRAEAEKEFRRSLEIEPTLQGYWNLGIIEWKEGRRTEAESTLQKALSLSPSNARAHIILGLFYKDVGRSGDAARELRMGLQTDPANPQALVALKQLELQATHAPR